MSKVKGKPKEPLDTRLAGAIAVVKAMAEGSLPITEKRLKFIAIIEREAVEVLGGERRKWEEHGSPLQASLTRLHRAIESSPGLKRGFLITVWKHDVENDPDPARSLAPYVGALDWVLARAPDLGIVDL